MKLNELHKSGDKEILVNYLTRLKNLMSKNSGEYLTESKKIIVTTEIVDDEERNNISPVAREEFVNKAKALGNFTDNTWVNQMINGLKQVGVQGMNQISEDDKPVTNKDIKQLIQMLIDLVSK